MSVVAYEPREALFIFPYFAPRPQAKSATVIDTLLHSANQGCFPKDFPQPQPWPQSPFFFGRTSLARKKTSVRITMPTAMIVCQSILKPQ